MDLGEALRATGHAVRTQQRVERRLWRSVTYTVQRHVFKLSLQQRQILSRVSFYSSLATWPSDDEAYLLVIVGLGKRIRPMDLPLELLAQLRLDPRHIIGASPMVPSGMMEDMYNQGLLDSNWQAV